MWTPTVKAKSVTHLAPWRYRGKIEAVSANRFVPAFGNRRAAFIQQAELAAPPAMTATKSERSVSAPQENENEFACLHYLIGNAGDHHGGLNE